MQTKEKMQEIGRSVKAQLPEGCGFALFVWNHDQPGAANYISSSNRPDVVKALQTFIDRDAQGRVVDTPHGN